MVSKTLSFRDVFLVVIAVVCGNVEDLTKPFELFGLEIREISRSGAPGYWSCGLPGGPVYGRPE